MNLPALRIDHEALSLLENIKQRAQEEIQKANKIPVAILIWGPSSDAGTEFSDLRLKLRTELSGKGHLAQFSEELVDNEHKMSIKMQQLIHAQQFDLIISIPASIGSVAEIHDFVLDNRLNKKIVVFINEDFDQGYSYQSLLSTSTKLTYSTVTYKDSDDLDTISKYVFEEVQKIREVKYFNQGRWT